MPHPSPSGRRPFNILYLHCHDMGRYLQPYGHAIDTPNLQRLAEQGVLFRQAFCVNPTCSPSRAALLTGRYAHCNGMLGLAHRGFTLADPTQHLCHTLAHHGYATALAGFQHLAARDFASVDDLGYTHRLCDTHDRSAITRAAVDFIGADHDKPFFLDVGYTEPHRVGESFNHEGSPADERYLRPPAPLPDTPRTRRDMAVYHASVRTMDHHAGRVLAALDRAGLAERTLVIATTDHGIAFPAMKCQLTDHGTGVSLILRGPSDSLLAGGRVCDAMVSHLDLFPTVCELAGIDAPAWLQGDSLMPLMRGDVDELHGELFAEVNHHAAYEPMRSVRTKRWKYIRRFDGRESVVLPNCDDSPSKTLWYEAGWRDQPRPAEMLFDLVFDPNEANNLADDPRCAPVLDDLRDRVDRWMRDTDDPLLRGPIPIPAGGVTTDLDDYSPSGGGPKLR